MSEYFCTESDVNEAKIFNSTLKNCIYCVDAICAWMQLDLWLSLAVNVAYHIAACDPLVQFTKLEAIRDIEREVQQRWEREKTFEIDAPKVCATL